MFNKTRNTQNVQLTISEQIKEDISDNSHNIKMAGSFSEPAIFYFSVFSFVSVSSPAKARDPIAFPTIIIPIYAKNLGLRSVPRYESRKK